MANDKVDALNYALQQTDDLLHLFEHVIRDDFPYDDKVLDFTQVAKRIVNGRDSEDTDIMKKLAGIASGKPVDGKPVEKVNGVEDERLNMSLERLAECAGKCERCRLCKTRKSVVFGEGCSDHPDIMVIGEGPGETEDNTGRPFVGKAGQYLDRWLAPISCSRDKNVYIANIVKCRPPQNRDPQYDEKEACKVFLQQQIALIKPRAILSLGRPASSMITGMSDAPIGSLRGRLFVYDNSIPVMCTYHPAAVLRDESLKVAVWSDLKKLAGYLNLEIRSAR